MDIELLLSNILTYLGAGTTLISSLIGLFILIPGDEPERTLKKILRLVKRISIK